MFSFDTIFNTILGSNILDLNIFNQESERNPFQIPYILLNHWETAATHLLSPLVSREQIDHIYFAILQRPVENDQAYNHHLASHSRIGGLIEALFCSVEYHERCLNLVEAAFPKARYIVHAHVPKTAGTTFTECALDAGFAMLNLNASPEDKTLDYLRSNLPFEKIRHKGVCISGHRYIYDILVGRKFEYEAIMFVRDPIERAISYYNYATGLAKIESEVYTSHYQSFVSSGLDIGSIEHSLSNGFLQYNEQCRYLAPSATYKDAIEAARAYSCRIVPFEAVLKEVSRIFDRSFSHHVNRSVPKAQLPHLSDQLLSSILLDHSQDVLLYQMAVRTFSKSERLYEKIIAV